MLKITAKFTSRKQLKIQNLYNALEPDSTHYKTIGGYKSIIQF
jgi:hypothetical protein